MRVMIVEDQTMIRSLLESYFPAEEGHRIVASIPGAKQAVEICRTSHVDLILMDVQTEHRENGLSAVRQIKAMNPKIKIIVVTSLAPPIVNVGLAKSTEFTKTELKVLRYLLRGLSYTRIASEMGCEMSTVKFHVANMLQKTGLENKLQLALAVSNVKLIVDLDEK